MKMEEYVVEKGVTDNRKHIKKSSPTSSPHLIHCMSSHNQSLDTGNMQINKWLHVL
jgi:hypothetical protein